MSNLTTFPPYVNCSLCPAQAMPEWDGLHFIFENVNFPDKLHLKRYICPARHEVFIEGRENKPLLARNSVTKDMNAVQTER